MASTRFALDPRFAVPTPAQLGELAVLVEPTSVVAKAWERIDQIRADAPVVGKVLITGAGPIGLLAALLSRARGHETHIVDVVDTGPKPAAADAIGATYHVSGAADLGPTPDIVIECTGNGAVVIDAIGRSAPCATVCLTGLSTGARTIELDAAALNRHIVLENDVVFGSVNAHRRHYEAAVAALAAADAAWLRSIITRTVALPEWPDAIERHAHDIKVCLDLRDPFGSRASQAG
jgi:threonine dehydrogenase-like Zn-dependent dehydrogenase